MNLPKSDGCDCKVALGSGNGYLGALTAAEAQVALYERQIAELTRYRDQWAGYAERLRALATEVRP